MQFTILYTVYQEKCYMTLISEARAYRLSDADMIMFASLLVRNLKADITELSEFGVTMEKISAFQTQADEFELILPDEVYLSTITGAVEEKNAIDAQLKEHIRVNYTRTVGRWGENSVEARSLGVKGMNDLSEFELFSFARRFQVLLGRYQPDLVDYGLTPEKLLAFKALTDAYEIALGNVNDKMLEREAATKDRIDKANALYEQIVKFTEFGKRAFFNSNPAKYSQYVIYGREAGPVKPPVMIGYRPGDFVISWGAVENATSYELEYSPDGSAWTVAYTGSDDAVQYIPAVEGWAYFRCRARNSNGYGEFSEVLKAGYYQQIPPPSNVKAKIEEHTENGLLLTWDEVPSATVYKIYTSVVPIGSPSNSFVFLGKPKENNYSCEIERGKRHYFQLTAENSAQWSQRSAAIYLDVE